MQLLVKVNEIIQSIVKLKTLVNFSLYKLLDFHLSKTFNIQIYDYISEINVSNNQQQIAYSTIVICWSCNACAGVKFI